MSIHRITMEIDVDDELLADHNGDDTAPPNDLNDWYGGDVEAAFRLGIAEPVHEPIQIRNP